MRPNILNSAAMTLALSCAISPAFAQETDLADEVEKGSVKEDMIIVTARKIDEALEDVPGSISVLSGEDANLLALDGAADYLRQLPNTIQVSGGPEFLQDVSIRGQGGGRQGFSESATGIYRNGIFVAGGGFGGRSFNRLDFLDIDKVEVYRGPQGALYGRNAVGGAVNVVSKRPNDTLSAEFKAGWEDVDRFDLSAIVNVPLGQDIAARLGVLYIDQSDGFITDINSGEAVDQQEFFGIRGSLQADISPSTSIGLTFEYFDSETPSFSALGQRISGVFVPLPLFLGGPQTGDADPGPFESGDSSLGIAFIEEINIFADLESDFGFADFTAVFNFEDRDAIRIDDDLDSFLGFQGIDIGPVSTDITVDQSEDFQRFVGELRLASKPEEAVTWLIGADILSFDDAVETENDGTSPLAGLASLATQQSAFVDELFSFSIFGLVGFDLSDGLNFSIEARFQQDNRDFNFVEEQDGAVTIATGDLEETFTRFLPAFTLSYDLNDEQLIYLRGASGFRPGGFNSGVDVASIDLIPFDPEIAWSIETGWKGRLANGLSFGLTAFYVFTDDIQAVSTLSTTDTTTALLNVGDTNIWGIEAQISDSFDLGSGRVRWSANAATTQGTFSDGSTITTSGGGPVVEVVDLSGARVNRTRDFVGSISAFYFQSVSSEIDIFFGGSAQGETGGFENATGDTDSPTGRDLQGFFLVDLRAGISGENWRLSIFGENLTNNIYRVQQVFLNDFFNEPRNFGVDFAINF